MSAIGRLTAAGFLVELVPPDGIGITPAEILTDVHRKWIRSDRSRILEELIASNDPDIWQRFVDIAVSYGCTAVEVETMFSQQDKADLLDVPRDNLPLHARTISQAAIRKRRVVPIMAGIQMPTCNRQTCGTWQNFKRVAHPHLGMCASGEPEGIAGNWDAESRNHRKKFLTYVDLESSQ